MIDPLFLAYGFGAGVLVKIAGGGLSMTLSTHEG
jgi:hypothetical protein